MLDKTLCRQLTFDPFERESSVLVSIHWKFFSDIYNLSKRLKKCSWYFSYFAHEKIENQKASSFGFVCWLAMRPRTGVTEQQTLNEHKHVTNLFEQCFNWINGYIIFYQIRKAICIKTLKSKDFVCASVIWWKNSFTGTVIKLYIIH